MMYKILSWDEFREVCTQDAFNWIQSGYTAEELTEDDILSEYPEEYFDSDYQETDDFSSCFSPREFAESTLECMKKFEEESK